MKKKYKEKKKKFFFSDLPLGPSQARKVKRLGIKKFFLKDSTNIYFYRRHYQKYMCKLLMSH